MFCRTSPLFASIFLLCLLLPQPKPASAATATSQHYPIMVHYDPGEVSSSYVQEVIAVAEDSWDFNVNTLQFPPPPADDGVNGSDDYDIFLEETPYQALCRRGVLAPGRPYGYTSKVIMDPSAIPEYAVGIVLAHEFHHAVQLGMRPFTDTLLEGGVVMATAVQRMGESYLLGYLYGINEFQTYPERSLDWTAELGNFYPYGSGLFLIYLEQAHGDMPTFQAYRQVWDYVSTQEDATYIDAINDVTPIADAYAEFSRWRYFLGPQDDGFHFDALSTWEGPAAEYKLQSVALMDDIDRDGLPYDQESWAMPYGARYLRLDISELAEKESLSLRFQGAASTVWRVQTMLLTPGQQAVEEDHLADADGSLAITVEPQGHKTLVVVPVNVGDGNYTAFSQPQMDLFQLQLEVKTEPEKEESSAKEEPDTSGCSMHGEFDGGLALVTVLFGLIVCGRGRRFGW